MIPQAVVLAAVLFLSPAAGWPVGRSDAESLRAAPAEHDPTGRDRVGTPHTGEGRAEPRIVIRSVSDDHSDEDSEDDPPATRRARMMRSALGRPAPAEISLAPEQWADVGPIPPGRGRMPLRC